MGFDAIDRAFRRKEIRPECVECGKTEGVKLRYPGEEDAALMCTDCYCIKEQRHWAGI